MPKITEAQKQFILEQSYRDSFFFYREVLGYKDSLTEWVNEKGKKESRILKGDQYGISPLGPHAQMVDLLQNGGNSVLLLTPRGSYKSSVAEVFCVEQITKNRNVRILYAMETFQQSRKKLKAIRNILEHNEVLNDAFGKFKSRDWSDSQFTVAGRTKHGLADPSMTAGSVGTNLTGAHYDIIILDDIVTPDSVKSDVGIKNTQDYFAMVEPYLDPGGKLIVIGTRYADADLYGDIKRTMDDEFNILEIDCGFDMEVEKGGKLFLTGGPKFVHLTHDVLSAKLRKMGSAAFASQYQLRCLSSDAQIFRREHFKQIQWAEWMKRLRGFILTDTAVKTEDKGCFGVIAMVALDSNNVAYLLDLKVGRWAPFDYVDELFSVYDNWNGKVKVAHVMMENVTMNETFLAIIKEEQRKRGTSFTMRKVPRADRNKEHRIARLQGRMEQGKFYVVNTITQTFQDGQAVRDLYRNYGHKENGISLPSGELVDQFIRFPVGTHNDIPDALADIDALDSKGYRMCNGEGDGGAVESPMDNGRIIPNQRGRRRQPMRSGSRWSGLVGRINRG